MERKSGRDVARYEQVRNLPTPINNGLYEMTMKAFEKGCPNFEHPLIVRGLITKPFKEGRSWKIKGRGVEMFFRWYMNHIPSGVVEGKRYTIIGDLLSANQGHKFVMDDCVVIPKHTPFKQAYEAVIVNHVMPINTYIEKPDRDTFFIKE